MSKYCFDTSALIDAWVRHYSPDVMEGFWELLAELIDDGTIICCKDVYNELEKKDDELLAWCKVRKDKFQELDEQTIIKLQEIMRKYPLLVDTSKGKNKADPIVIAVASAYNLTVVTEENGGSDNKPKIPHICKKEKIKCINLLAFLREQNMKFSYKR